MADDPILATFPEATYADWRALVEATGDGRVVEDLARTDLDGLAIEPLYAAEHAAYLDPGWPGFAPYVRGATPLGSAIGGWEVRQLHRLGDQPAADVARAVREDLAGGATGLAFAGDVAHSIGDVLAGAEAGGVPIHLEPGPDGIAAAEALAEAWRRMGVVPGEARGGFGIDPLGVAAAAMLQGEDVAAVDVGKVAVAAARFAEAWPAVSQLVVDVRPYDEGGATPAQALGIALATGVAYLRALEGVGMGVAEAAGRMRFAWAVEADVFGGAALLRAARRAWARVLEACGEAGAMRVDVTTSRRLVVEGDPENHIVRTTLAVVGAALGGAEAIVVRPEAHGRRMARNVQRVLLDEAQLNRVVDAAGGSYWLEARTEALALAGWARFQAIEQAGGMAAALEGGMVRAWLSEAAAERAARRADGRDVVVGVDRYAEGA